MRGNGCGLAWNWRRRRGYHNALRKLGQTILFRGANSRQDQFGEKIKASHIGIVEAVSLAGKGFDQSDNALLCREWYGNHGAGAQSAAGLGVDPGVGFGVVATNGLAAAQAGTGEA